jgi:multicomponent K+:H+ antiporter subunit G
MSIAQLPLWAAIPAALLLVLGGLLTVTGSLGLLRLPTFYMRMHGPAMGNTLGTGCILIASMLVGSVLARRLIVHELIITVFMVVTAPVASMLIVRAAIYRTGVNAERQRKTEPAS